MVKGAEAERLLVRLPRDVKTWLESEASYNGASQNSEIIRSIRARMQKQPERVAG
ncbi:Arc family DNA-binding protein [Bradyrhizobium sp. AUGA SZCCT0182]|uniref:Arc family DNA-binding protein n=1 Tax=Bradyrhizobium sp. AUGA SZCCT0182 TaxID=2807667 RepID=UPI001BACBBD2|nr:Arc family DNA-binding protein [Bradyrhizobium sp. AUGA SZCCT0182]MBR1233663.1 Arc family DNA-binding protein [Bradyrhizobium sp. AUGA SZCCT0182]